MVSQSGGPAARQGHRYRAPDTIVMPPLTWKGSIVPLPPNGEYGPTRGHQAVVLRPHGPGGSAAAPRVWHRRSPTP